MESPMELPLHVSIIAFFITLEEKLLFRQHVAGSLVWVWELFLISGQCNA